MLHQKIRYFFWGTIILWSKGHLDVQKLHEGDWPSALAFQMHSYFRPAESEDPVFEGDQSWVCFSFKDVLWWFLGVILVYVLLFLLMLMSWPSFCFWCCFVFCFWYCFFVFKRFVIFVLLVKLWKLVGHSTVAWHSFVCLELWILHFGT